MEQTVCEQCRFFIQHYVLSAEGRLAKACCGHCIKDRPKGKRPSAKGCEGFLPEEGRPRYVTKAYLCRELLKKVLDMELLPEELQE